MSEISESDEQGRRDSLRSRLTSRVKVIMADVTEWETTTINVSNIGICLSAKDWEVPPVGEVVLVQVQDLSIEAPKMAMKIVRVDGDMVGLTFDGVDQFDEGDIMPSDEDVLERLERMAELDDEFDNLEDDNDD